MTNAKIDFKEVIDADIVLAALIVERMRLAGKNYEPAALELLKVKIVAFEQYRVETQRDANWHTKIEDAEGNECGRYFSGCKKSAAVAHCWAILKAAGKDIDDGRG